MNKVELSRQKYIYYDIDQKTIGRTPTRSNVKQNGSDNSLYMGLISNGKIKNIICNILGKNEIKEFNNKIFKLSFYSESVEVQTNINNDGQLQFKIVGNGHMHSMLKKYEKYIGKKIDINNLIIFLDFLNYEIYFEEITTYAAQFDKVQMNNAKNEIKSIINKANKECKDINSINAYVETMLNVRNNVVQKKFRKDLFIEFDGKCAICGINKKELLIASHILPYSKCKNIKQMIDHNNGLLLCCNHDSLFDKGFISFNENTGKIEISNNDKLNRNLYGLLSINEEISLPNKFLNEKRKQYLSKHHII